MYNAHSKYIGKQILLSFIFCAVDFLLFAFCSQWHSIFCLIPLIGLIFLLILLVRERKKFETKRPVLRIVFLIINLIILLLAISLSKDIENETVVSISSAVGLCLTYEHLIVSFISWIIVKVNENKNLEKQNQTDELDPINSEEKVNVVVKKLPLGYISKKDRNRFVLSTLLVILISIIVTVLFQLIGVNSIIVTFVVLFIGIIVLVIIRAIRMEQPLINFENDFDIEKFQNYCLEIVNNPIVHNETRNYYNILLANYVGFFSLDKRKEILDKVFVPSFPGYKINYYLVDSLQYNDDKDKIYKYFEDLKNEEELKSKKYQKIINKILRQHKIVFGDLGMENFEKDFPIARKTKLVYLNNKILKLKCYFYRNDVENVNNMIKEIEEFLNTIPNYPKNDDKITKYKL